ncbi:MAG: nucleoside hydrolase [Halieaceae bacterium]|jgi:purine nucleosidase|nr:nucleoside hydrolase [Halieaceae bacterium]
MARHKVFIDCDPGVDDCIALMVALGCPDDIELVGVGVVAGNVPVDICARNAAGVLALAGRSEVPLHVGCPRPLIVPPEFAEHIHGPSGLGDAELPEADLGLHPHAVDALCALLASAEPASITVVITGPMTNLAVALVRSPQIAVGIKEIVIMGGAREAGGNITASAEFNIHADPHAAHIVLTCGRPITMIGLDATLQIRCTAERMARMESSAHRAVVAAKAMVDHVNRVYGKIYGTEGAALHDPCTVGYLLAPALFTLRPAQVAVEMNSGLTRGHTAVDFQVTTGAAANVNWVTELDAPRLFDLLIERMERL